MRPSPEPSMAAWPKALPPMMGRGALRLSIVTKAAGRGRILSARDIAATPMLNMPWMETAVPVPQARDAEIARWSEIQALIGSEQGEAAWPKALPAMLGGGLLYHPIVPKIAGRSSILFSEVPTPYPPDSGPFAVSESVPMSADDATVNAPPLSQGAGEVSAMRHRIHWTWPIRQALAASRPVQALARMQRALAFGQHISAAAARISRRTEAMPLHLWTTEAESPRPLRAIAGAMTTGEPVVFDEPLTTWLPAYASGRGEEPRSSLALRSGQKPEKWLQSRKLLLAGISPEPDETAHEAFPTMQIDAPLALSTGSQYSPVEGASLLPESIFPSWPSGVPASISGFAEEVPFPSSEYVAPTELVFPRHEPSSAQNVVNSQLRSPAAAADKGIASAAEQLLGTLGVRSSHGAGPPPKLALAPVGRPMGGAGDSAVAAAPEAQQAEPEEERETEQPTEQDLDKLAREVYAVLKRRLARERERSLAVR